MLVGHLRLRPARTRDSILLAGCGALLLLLWPAGVQAYVGPGAGFAVLSSFLTLFLAFVYAIFALMTWPLRQVFRLLRRRKAYNKAKVKRVVIVGFDGMDPGLAARYMQEGKLPHLSRLRATGTFKPLATTCPPISPVAWSSFQTGVNPGKHNIYDFLARNSGSYLPYLSSAQIRDPKRNLSIGKYRIPLGKPRITLLRKAKPFWHYLGEAGVFSSILRIPITFPPEKFNGVLLSGMCVPDLRGSQGTFSYHTSHAAITGSQQGGVRVPLESVGRRYRSYLSGPEDHIRKNSAAELRIPFTIEVDSHRDSARLKIQSHRLTLKKGEYSDWIEIVFKASLGIRAHGICRFYLKETRPQPQIYVTPININPRKPALPISHPLLYGIYLAKLLGPFATLGLAEDTWALNEGVISDEAFLRQCYLIHDERERMFFDALEKTTRGVCACVFDITDRVQHMFWREFKGASKRQIVEGGPAGTSPVIEKLYRDMDGLVGRILERIGRDAVLVVISDHGFNSFERGVNVNTWLHQNGYLVLKENAPKDGEWFQHVDWSRTRAYAMGLNGLYINQKSRERSGIVQAGRESVELKGELRSQLESLRDSKTEKAPIRRVFDSQTAFAGPYRENAPDLIIGYADGYRAAWDSVTGTIGSSVFEENTKCWSGDHCIDPMLVPGVLFSNVKFNCEEPAIVDIAPTVLDLFGINVPLHFDGKPWRMELGCSNADGGTASGQMEER